MIRICYIIGTLDFGGAEKQLLKLCSALDRARFAPYVVVLRKGGPLLPSFLTAGIPVAQAGKRWKIDPLFFPGLVRRVRSIAPDIVHTFMFTANTWGRIAAILAGTPILVASERCIDPWKRWHHRLIDQLLLRRTAVVVPNSRPVRDFYAQKIGIPVERMVVIPNGVETDRAVRPRDSVRAEFGIPPDAPLVACAGRFTPQKGFRYFVAAMPEIVSALPETRFLLIGDGESRRALEEFAASLGMRSRAVFTGYRNDALDLLASADVVVTPSLFEGMPNVVMEAMSLGKPVVASAIKEMQELIRDRDNGILVPVRDPSAIANAVILLLSSPQTAAFIGNNAQETIRARFSVTAMVKRYEELYVALSQRKAAT